MNKKYNYENPFEGREPTKEEYEIYIEHLKQLNQQRVEFIKSCSDYYLVQHLDFTEEYLTYDEFIESERERKQEEALKKKLKCVHKELLTVRFD